MRFRSIQRGRNNAFSILRSMVAAMALVGWPIMMGNLPTVCAQAIKTSAPSEAGSSPLLDMAVMARDENANRLQSAYGSGRITREVQTGDPLQALTVMDSDIQLFYDRPRFRVHLAHDVRLVESLRSEEADEGKGDDWFPADVREQVIIFDGKKVYSVEFRGADECLGEIYFGFAKLAVMRSAGFPFEDPVDLWSQALSIESLERDRLALTPLDSDRGFIGLESRNTYYRKFYFLDQFGYDLRRVSSYRKSEPQPFRDYLLEWSLSNGVYYVSRFTNTVAKANGSRKPGPQTINRYTVRFTSFDANVDVNASVFSLDSVGMPEGTLLMDKRASVEGGPKQWIYRDGELQDARGRSESSKPLVMEDAR